MQPGEKSNLVLATDKFGQKLWVYDKDLIGMTILGGEFWDGPLLLPFYDRFSDPNKWAIEIGAFFGQGAIYLAKKNKRVLAVEPVYNNLLCKNVGENVRLGIIEDQKVIPILLAAYSHKTSMAFAPVESQGQDVTLPLDQIGNLGGVALVPRDYILNDQIIGWPLDLLLSPDIPISLIKIDAQGCDLQAIMGLKETIVRWKPPILFEWEEHLAKLHGDDWGDVLEWFRKLSVYYGVHYTLQSQAPRGYENCWVAIPEGVEYPNA